MVLFITAHRGSRLCRHLGPWDSVAQVGCDQTPLFESPWSLPSPLGTCGIIMRGDTTKLYATNCRPRRGRIGGRLRRVRRRARRGRWGWSEQVHLQTETSIASRDPHNHTRGGHREIRPARGCLHLRSATGAHTSKPQGLKHCHTSVQACPHATAHLKWTISE